ncbi:MAG: UTP--glucose-1-phosphate uridylyltransferase GalU [Candidatus Firestonebacteria bacterium]
MESLIRKAVIPAAGLGTRFLPATKAQPKEMLPIFDKPAIQYIVEEAVGAGIQDIILVTGRGKQAIENHFDKSFELEHHLKRRGHRKLLDTVEQLAKLVDIFYVRQKEPLGLGHAINCASAMIADEPFAVFLADDLIYSKESGINQLKKVYKEKKCIVFGVVEVPRDRVSSYGIIKGQNVGGNVFKVEDLIEKPAAKDAPSNLGIIGRYILTPEVLKVIPRLKVGKNGEIQLTDALKEICKEKPVYAVKMKGIRYDTGNKLGYMKASIEYALRDKEIGAELRSYLKKI